ncbi:MAG: HAD family hydrolase [Candidatus Limnocylindrales bacterium]
MRRNSRQPGDATGQLPPDCAEAAPGRGLLVLDFDGTLWRGTEAIEAYAEGAAVGLEPADREPFLSAVRAYLAGQRWRVLGGAVPPDDGWAAVARFGAAHGLDPAFRQRAFFAARERVAAGAVRMDVPDGLLEFLAWSRQWCTVVLASNSPGWSVEPVLDRLGFAPLLDDVACDAGKPDSLVGLIEGWIGRFRVPRGRVMSVGDHYRNDIDPVARAGWFTTYLSPWRWVPGPCSLVGTTMEEVLPELRAWVDVVAEGGIDGALTDALGAPGAPHGGARS